MQTGSVLGRRAPAGEAINNPAADMLASIDIKSSLRAPTQGPHKGIRLIWSALSTTVSGERRIKIAKIKHAMTNIRIGAAASSPVLDLFFWTSEAFDVVFGWKWISGGSALH